MKIRDIMRRGPWLINETDTLGNAQRVMTRGRLRHLPVLGGGKLVGILSERDLLAARARAEGEQAWWSISVHDAMTSLLQTAGPDDSVTEAAGRMAMSKIGALPIVERGKVIGIITATDVLEAEVRSAMEPTPVSTATASDVMTPWPITVRPEAPLYDAVARMVDRHIRHVPVVDEASTIVGMISERDVRTAVGSPMVYRERRSRSEGQYRVRDVMSRPAITAPFDQTVVELARTFADGKVGAVAIVDKFGALIGIVSYVDVLRALTA